jgi:hypothetical protein
MRLGPLSSSPKHKSKQTELRRGSAKAGAQAAPDSGSISLLPGCGQAWGGRSIGQYSWCCRLPAESLTFRRESCTTPGRAVAPPNSRSSGLPLLPGGKPNMRPSYPPTHTHIPPSALDIGLRAWASTELQWAWPEHSGGQSWSSKVELKPLAHRAPIASCSGGRGVCLTPPGVPFTQSAVWPSVSLGPHCVCTSASNSMLCLCSPCPSGS